MNDALQHHGILGQKWGVRRTPAELGHVPTGGSGGGSGKTSGEAKPAATKSPGKASKSSRVMSDDELRQRINRLNMEEQYENLVARQKARGTSTVKKLLGEAAENLGRKSLGVVVDKVVAKMSNKEDNFDINEWKNADVNKMDADTIKKVASWYKQATSITKARKDLSSKPSST